MKTNCFIHGETNNDSSIEKCSLVLGINESLKGDAKDNDSAFIWYKKFYQRIYKETSGTYMDWLEEHDQDCDQLNIPVLDIYFYGHSLDVTDKVVLQKVVLHKKCEDSLFYRYKAAMAKQIANLNKIIGEENLKNDAWSSL